MPAWVSREQLVRPACDRPAGDTPAVSLSVDADKSLALARASAAETAGGGSSSLAILSFLATRYPLRTATIVALLIIAGLSEGIGLISLLPLLSLIVAASAGRTEVDSGAVRLLTAVGVPLSAEALLALVVVAVSIKAVLVAVAMRQAGHATAAFAADLRVRLIRGLMRARWEHFVRHPVGGLANALGPEATRASEVLQGAASLLATVVQVIVYALVALVVVWYVTLGAVAAGGLIVILLAALVGLSRRAGERQTTATRGLLARLSDGLLSLKPLKAMGREGDLQRLLEQEARHLEAAQQRHFTSAAVLVGAQEVLLVAVLGAGIYASVRYFSIGFDQMIFMALIFYRTASRIGELQVQYQRIAHDESALLSIWQITNAADAATENVTGDALPNPRSSIALDRVGFSYASHPVLNEVSISIRVPSFVALIGRSGIGKTTLLDLLAGLYRPTIGAVLIDRMPLTEIDTAAWRELIGYVPQDPILFNDDVLTNVALRDPAIDHADVEAALAAAGALEFVQQLPDGLLARVGERGMALSGGQRQRIVIARALVRKPRLLLLDEPTSGLDPTTESGIMATLKELSRDITIVAVSHQRSFVQSADQIIDLDRLIAVAGSRPPEPASTSAAHEASRSPIGSG